MRKLNRFQVKVAEESDQPDNMVGKLIVIYGANNLGKSTQVEMLERALHDLQIPVKRIKYPIYDLEPTGPLINSIIRGGGSMPEEELQRTYVQNRRDYEPELERLLRDGTSVIAEDYNGTGIAWGLVRGVPLERLEKMNDGLRKEDIAILLKGERFETGREAGHRNETDDALWQKANENHLMLGERYGWQHVNANRERKVVHDEIMGIVRKEIGI